MEEIELSCYHAARRRAPLSTASFSPFASTGAEGPHRVHMMIPISSAAQYIFSGGIAHSSLYDQPKLHAIVGYVASSVSCVEEMCMWPWLWLEALLPWDECTAFCLKFDYFFHITAVSYFASTIATAWWTHRAYLFAVPKPGEGLFKISMLFPFW